MEHFDAIEKSIRNNVAYEEIARKLYLCYPTKAFSGQEETQYELTSTIAGFFGIPLLAVQVVGSAKTGFSLVKDTPFVPGESDLDVAIVDARLFASYMELSYQLSRRYMDGTAFPRIDGVSTEPEYLKNIQRGIFRPDLMPTGKPRAKWNDFFAKLSRSYSKLFRSVSAAVYLSETFLAGKQRSAIAEYVRNRPI